MGAGKGEEFLQSSHSLLGGVELNKILRIFFRVAVKA